MGDKNKLFSFRPGSLLLDKLDQLKDALGLSPSDAARKAMDKGLDRLLQEQAAAKDEKALSQMQCNVRGTLLTLLKKERAGNDLTRAEWGFLARFSNQTYDRLFHTIEVIDRELVVANMRSFAAVLELRDLQYPDPEKRRDDQYYFGNMGFSWLDRKAIGNDIQAHVEACIQGLPEHPAVGSGVFPSRNFNVALRDEPALDIAQLNAMLRPYLRSLLLVCLRGYWHENSAPILTSKDRPDGWRKTEEELLMPTDVKLNRVKNEHFVLSPIADETTINCAIESRHHSFVFTLNNFVEMTDFQTMIERVGTTEKHVSSPGFEISLINFPRGQTKARYMLAAGRWRHVFEAEEFDGLKTLLREFVEDLTVKSHLQKLEIIYGRA